MIIKIHGEIKNDEQKDFELAFFGVDRGVTFGSIDEAIAAKPDDDDTITLKIHCNGGLCTEGYAIYDRLRSVPDTTIEAEVEGECSSMATIILLAASKRRATENSRICIHKPRMPFYFCEEMTEDEAMKAYNDLHDETERMLKIYTERTGQSRETLEALMKEDKYITAEEAKDLGFIQEIVKPISATKMSKPNSLKRMLLGVCKAAGLTAEDLTEAVKEDESVAMTLTTEDGTEINIDIDEGEEPKVGDPASPDGTFVLNDGRTIVIEDGSITEIRPAEEQEPEEESKEALKARVAELESQLEAANEKGAKVEALTAENETLKAEAKTDADKAAIEFVAKAGGIEALAKMQSNYKPQGRVPEANAGEHVTETALQRELREKKEARKNRQEK